MSTKDTIRAVLAEQGEIRVGEVVTRTGLSRQAVHRHLRAMVVAGELRREGKGRNTRYLHSTWGIWSWRVPLVGQEEHRVWRDLISPCPALQGVEEEARSSFLYAFSEMLNNAIDHSRADEATVQVKRQNRHLSFEVQDPGIGALQSVASVLELPSTLEALQELVKGKVTTDPDRHTGEGIFFTSKAGAAFELESGGWTWRVDNKRRDFAIAEGTAAGTRVAFFLDLDHVRPLQEIFEEFTTDFVFNRTRVHVKLYEIDSDFVSRSEARRILSGLDRFEEVELDFQGVKSVGQGFADEVFRVWAAGHPKVALHPTHMATPVAFMVERARR